MPPCAPRPVALSSRRAKRTSPNRSTYAPAAQSYIKPPVPQKNLPNVFRPAHTCASSRPFNSRPRLPSEYKLKLKTRTLKPTPKYLLLTLRLSTPPIPPIITAPNTYPRPTRKPSSRPHTPPIPISPQKTSDLILHTLKLFAIFAQHNNLSLVMAKITVQNTDISIVKFEDEDYISLTDMARSQMQEHIIFRWLSLKSTIEYLGEWEILYNPDFNCNVSSI